MRSVIRKVTQIITERRFIELSEEPGHEDLRDMLNKGFERVTKRYLNRMPDKEPEESEFKRFRVDTGRRYPSKRAADAPDSTLRAVKTTSSKPSNQTSGDQPEAKRFKDE